MPWAKPIQRKSATGQTQGDEEACRACTHGGNVGKVLGRGFAPHIVTAAGGFQNELATLTRPRDAAGPKVAKSWSNESVGGDHCTLTGAGAARTANRRRDPHRGFNVPSLACRSGRSLWALIGMKACRTRTPPPALREVSRMGLSRVSLKSEDSHPLLSRILRVTALGSAAE